MATVTFNVSGCNPTGGCIVSQNGNATVNKNDKVQWNITGNTVASISITLPNPIPSGDSNIWSSPPAPVPNSSSGSWRGTIGTSGNIGENYTITCVCSGKTFSHDPRISVNP